MVYLGGEEDREWTRTQAWIRQGHWTFIGRSPFPCPSQSVPSPPLGRYWSTTGKGYFMEIGGGGTCSRCPCLNPCSTILPSHSVPPQPPLPPGDAVEDLLRQRVKQAVALDANQQRFVPRARGERGMAAQSRRGGGALCGIFGKR